MMTHSRHTLNIFALLMPSRIEIVKKQRDKQIKKVQDLKRQMDEANAKAIGLDAELDALENPDRLSSDTQPGFVSLAQG